MYETGQNPDVVAVVHTNVRQQAHRRKEAWSAVTLSSIWTQTAGRAHKAELQNTSSSRQRERGENSAEADKGFIWLLLVTKRKGQQQLIKKLLNEVCAPYRELLATPHE